MTDPAFESWELNVLGVYDIVSPHPTTGLEEWFAFLARSGSLAGDVCEFGVFRGRSLIGAALLLQQLGDDRRIIGFDTFTGFPALAHEDLPERFEELAAQGRITADHLARVRRNAELLAATGRSIDPMRSSTSGSFDATSRALIEERAGLVGVAHRIELFEGDFAPSLAQPANQHRTLSGVLIDSDLHDGYAAVLPWAWDRMVPGGMIYLDEYYSLKFPGPRIAVDAFCDERGIRPTLLRRDGSFERWAIMR
jgi:predicted O-methyltransferase YrrM